MGHFRRFEVCALGRERSLVPWVSGHVHPDGILGRVAALRFANVGPTKRRNRVAIRDSCRSARGEERSRWRACLLALGTRRDTTAKPARSLQSPTNFESFAMMVGFRDLRDDGRVLQNRHGRGPGGLAITTWLGDPAAARARRGWMLSRSRGELRRERARRCCSSDPRSPPTRPADGRGRERRGHRPRCGGYVRCDQSASDRRFPDWR